jgi:hypothetical protein
MARWSRDIIVTEKIDGTNSQVLIADPDDSFFAPPLVVVNGLGLWAGSRTRWLNTTSAGDNFGFAKWVEAHAEELMALGEGRHFGEWWGQGIQRNYGLAEKRFSLFNASRWADSSVRPACCDVVPVLYEGPNCDAGIEIAMSQLTDHGSYAAPGFNDPEGIIIWHTAANIGFKKTIEDDHQPKGQQ